MSSPNPTGIAATRYYATPSITVSWTNGTPVDGTELERRANGGAYGLLQDLSSAYEHWVDATISYNVAYGYRVRSYQSVLGERTYSDYDELAAPVTIGNDTCTDTATVTDVMTDVTVRQDTCVDTVTSTDVVIEAGQVWANVFTDTLSITDLIGDAQSLRLAFSYYLGTNDGIIYEYADNYKSDGGVPIETSWETKIIDFYDQMPDWANRFKSMTGCMFYYQDDGPIEVTLNVSGNGGKTYAACTKTIGTAAAPSVADDCHFFFYKTGSYFRFKVESKSAIARPKWLGMMVDVDEAGDHFPIS
jgi:hypothetical protein